MEEFLRSVLSRIADGTLLPPDYFENLDCDKALDARDGDSEFETNWLRALAELDRRWPEAGVSQAHRSLAEDIRRESFLAVSRATEQNEIASYVSDDFDLITRARLIGMKDELIDQMWHVYQRGEFPFPPVG